MVPFLQLFVIFITLNEFFINFWVLYENLLNPISENHFISFFFFFFILRFFFNKKKEIFHINSDLLFKYYSLFLKNPSFLLNYTIVTFKKIYLYFRHFRFKFFISTMYILLKRNWKKYLLIWRPLFKKFSYFGYYRSNRSKWIK